jgi:hypothetical protein
VGAHTTILPHSTLSQARVATQVTWVYMDPPVVLAFECNNTHVCHIVRVRLSVSAQLGTTPQPCMLAIGMLDAIMQQQHACVL